jgi:hypothetical protein
MGRRAWSKGQKFTIGRLTIDHLKSKKTGLMKLVALHLNSKKVDEK